MNIDTPFVLNGIHESKKCLIYCIHGRVGYGLGGLKEATPNYFIKFKNNSRTFISRF